MKKLMIILLLSLPSLALADTIINSDGKWSQVGQGQGNVKGYILTEPSVAYITTSKARFETQKAVEAEAISKETDDQLKIDDLQKQLGELKERLDVLEQK